jgi:hypothetical protein
MSLGSWATMMKAYAITHQQDIFLYKMLANNNTSAMDLATVMHGEALISLLCTKNCNQTMLGNKTSLVVLCLIAVCLIYLPQTSLVRQ